MTKEAPYYDEDGIEILEYAVLKVYHYYGKTLRGGIGRVFMYKWVRLVESNGQLYWKAKHLTNDKDQGYWLKAVADKETRVIKGTKVVQQYD